MSDLVLFGQGSRKRAGWHQKGAPRAGQAPKDTNGDGHGKGLVTLLECETPKQCAG